MKIQWNLLFGIIFAVIVAVFAVINVDSVTVNYLFGTGQWPLILVILISVLLGGLMIGSAGLIKIYSLQRKWKAAVKEKEALQLRVQELESFQSGSTEIVDPISIKSK
ncbi:LapA family protein [Niallia taxi]|uniref:LapA family protein n=1 Tax=Niallia taxi TaxID=2499688 RepID=UPI00300960E7